jgi:hypothetical protein
VVYEYAFTDHTFGIPKGEDFQPKLLHNVVQSARSLARTCRQIRSVVRNVKLSNLTLDFGDTHCAEWSLRGPTQDLLEVIERFRVGQLAGHVLGAFLSDAPTATKVFLMMKQRLPALRGLLVASSFAVIDTDEAIGQHLKDVFEQYGVAVKICDDGT